MKTLRACLPGVILSFSIAGSIAGEATNAAPKPEAIVRAGQETLQRLTRSPASWTVKCRLPNGIVLDTKVVRSGEQVAWTFSQIIKGESDTFCRIVQSNNLWYVEEKNHVAKYRPFEAELHFPAAYVFVSLSDLKVVADASQLAVATLESRQANRLSYRLPLPPEVRRTLEQIVSEYNNLVAKNPKFADQPEVSQVIAQAKEQLAHGTAIVVDERTGVLLATRLNNMQVEIEEFRWLTGVPPGSLTPTAGILWDDQSQPWPDSDLKDCVMVARDPIYVAALGKLSVDGYVLNLKTGGMRRVPYVGSVSMPGCFLPDRREVIVAGVDVIGKIGTVKVNLATGRNEALTSGAFSGVTLAAEMSPDGSKVATLRGLGEGSKMLEGQIQILDLKTGQTQNLGKPASIGAPFSWLPDGNGLVLKRFERSEGTNATDTTILCRMDLDGKMTDLPGDWPIVLRKTKKILHQEWKTRLWHTCDLDGSHPELFAGGLKDHAMPAVSPDETKVLFAYYEKGKLPQLILFDLGKTNGTPVVKANGFTSMPVWR